MLLAPLTGPVCIQYGVLCTASSTDWASMHPGLVCFPHAADVHEAQEGKKGNFGSRPVSLYSLPFCMSFSLTGLAGCRICTVYTIIVCQMFLVHLVTV